MAKTTVIVIGAGGMARSHITRMLEQRRTTEIAGLVEVSRDQLDKTRAVFEKRGRPCPPCYTSIAALLKAQGPADAAFICTPHKFHLQNACECLKAGMDVLLEKPMVLNAAEARRLIKTRDATGRLLVVAFPGSLSPAIRKAKDLIRKGAIGRVTSVSAFVHQGWKKGTTGTWRQVPDISGGGFLFDTGSHMINTVVDLLGDDVARVTAIMDNRGTPVEISSTVGGQTAGGVMFSLTGAGDSVQCISQIHVFGDAGVLETGIWGERLRIRTLARPEFEPVPFPKSSGAWEQFLKVRAGRMENPCPPEIGLRFALLMDMIRESAVTGRTVTLRRR